MESKDKELIDMYKEILEVFLNNGGKLPKESKSKMSLPKPFSPDGVSNF